MEKEQRNLLYNTVVRCRRLLEDDFAQQLEGTYGVHSSGRLEPIESLAHLDAIGRADRQAIASAIAHFEAAGSKRPQAVQRFIRESAFTFLNRLAALKLMEHPSRALIQPSLVDGRQSKGFTQFALISPEAMRAQKDGGYRLYLELLFDDLSQALGILFDRTIPTSILFAGETVLGELLALLNAPELADVWGEDETIGWVYQYFTPTELREEARKASSAPRNSYELAFRNQFYTPRYVVEFLTDNTLGRTWYEMRRGETSLIDSCRYMIRRKRPVFLNPGETPPLPYDLEQQHRQDSSGDGQMWLRPNPELDELRDIFAYALTVDGYRYAQQQWDIECGELANERLAQYHDTGQWQGSFDELRCCLFYEQRRYHHFGWDPEGEEKEAILALYQALCDQWALEVEFIEHRPKRDPRTLRILDPACGSGHFLLYAFDLLLTIYDEAYDDPELGPALQADFPDRDAYRRQLPQLILAHNLHGIDIDRRAVQIAALALWLRAQRAWADQGVRRQNRPAIAQIHIVTAEPMPGEYELLGEFVRDLQPAILGNMLRDIWDQMKLAGEAGSLLKIEQHIQTAVRDARLKLEALPQAVQLTLFGPDQPPETYNTADLDDETFWAEAEERVLVALRAFAAEAAGAEDYGAGVTRRLFASDAAQGMAFIDLLQQPFDVVLMNPPFGAASTGSRTYIGKAYPRTKNDLYAAFVERGLELLRPRGYLGAITSRTGFFLGTFKTWREEILIDEARFAAMADLGWGVLDTAMVETAAYVIENNQTEETAAFIRALTIPVEQKGRFVQDLVGNIVAAVESLHVWMAEPGMFSLSRGTPFAYWIHAKTLSLLDDFPTLEPTAAEIKVGLQTSDDPRFVRAIWEIDPLDSYFCYYPSDGSSFCRFDDPIIKAFLQRHRKRAMKWAFHVKAGSSQPWYSPLTVTVNWEGDGYELRDFRDSQGKQRSVLRNEIFYFRPGFSWTRRAVRLVPYVVPSNAISTVSRYMGFPHPGKELMTVGYVASNLATGVSRFTGEMFERPNYLVDMIKNLPWAEGLMTLKSEFEALITSEVNRRKRVYSFIEPFQDFVYPSLLGGLESSYLDGLTYPKESLLGREMEFKVAEAFELGEDELQQIERDMLESIEFQQGSADLEDNESQDNDLVIEYSRKEEFEALIQYAVGCVFGRWDIRMALNPDLVPQSAGPFEPLPVCPPGSLVSPIGLPARSGDIVSEEWLLKRPTAITLPDEGEVGQPTIADSSYPLPVAWDGILVDDPIHPSDVVARVRDALALLWGDRAGAIEQEACDILGVNSLRDYVRDPRNGFFAFHIKRYSKSRRKAPIYWLLQSANRNYAIWLYIHRMDDSSYYTAARDYADTKVNLEAARLDELHEGLSALSGSAQKRREREIEQQEKLVDEVTTFRNTLDKIALLGLPPDLNDGVVIGIAPLHELVPWKEAEKYWHALLDGEYEWSTMAQRLRERGLVK